MQKIYSCLWFDGQAEQAALFYTSIFPNSAIKNISRYTEAGNEVHGQDDGQVMTVEFNLSGIEYMGLNGGPLFKFTEAISQVVNCDSQSEIDYFWGKLSEGGDPQAQQCGWLKDKFGLSWQIIPSMMADFFPANDSEKSKRTMEKMLKMKKLIIEDLKNA